MAERLSPVIEKKIPYEGFADGQEKVVSAQLKEIGLPLDNVSEVVYRPNPRGGEQILGSLEPDNGRLTLYKSLEKLPVVAQQGTMVHEVTHSLSPFDPRNESIYGSREAMEKARDYASSLAKQSLKTKTWLNGYQAYLAKQLDAGQIDQERFTEESRAIAVELLFTNKNHLNQVNESQLKKLNGSGINIVSGAEDTVISLIDGVESKEDLDQHLVKVRKSFKDKGKLFNSTTPYAPKAFSFSDN